MTILICLSVGWTLLGCEEAKTKSLRMGELNMSLPMAPLPGVALPQCPAAPVVNLGVSVPSMGNAGIVPLPSPQMAVGSMAEMNAVREVPVEVGE